MQAIIESKYPEKFSFELLKDDGRTGRLEVAINGENIHSKENGDGLITDDNKDAFLEKVAKTLE